jgi:hypothetical protein
LAVPSVLKSAKTSSSWTSRRAFWTALGGSYASSSVTNSILRPSTPPFAFTYLKFAWAPCSIER